MHKVDSRLVWPYELAQRERRKRTAENRATFACTVWEANSAEKFGLTQERHLPERGQNVAGLPAKLPEG